MPHTSSMDELGRETLRELVQASGPCVSLFLPTHRAGAETTQAPIRLKNLLRHAEEQLEQSTMRSVEARQMLEPARRLVDDYGFWQHQSDGLAVYVSRDTFRAYRLPISFKEQAVAGDRFFLKPLIPVLTENEHFYIFAISLNLVRLLKCTRFSVDEISLEGMPTSMAEAMAPENIEADSSYQIYGASPPPSGNVTSRTASVIGRGRTDVDPKDRLQEYFRKIDAGICERVKDDPAPVVLAAVEFHHPLYRQGSSCSWLMEEGILGNPDLLRPEQLLEQALPLIEPSLLNDRERDRSKFEEQLGTGRVSKDWAEIVPAALQGRVEAMFTADGAEQWGRINPDSWEVEVHPEIRPGDTDLLDLATIRAWLSGARVYLVPAADVPGSGTVAAVFRY